MLKDAISKKKMPGIPARAQREWDLYTKGITESETQLIFDWIEDKFDAVASRKEKVQPSGWLGSGFDWRTTDLGPIYRECRKKMSAAPEEEVQAKSGQIFGLYISLYLAEHQNEEWLFVKGDDYKAHGVPIQSRIYFLPT